MWHGLRIAGETVGIILLIALLALLVWDAQTRKVPSAREPTNNSTSDTTRFSGQRVLVMSNRQTGAALADP